MEFQKPNEQQIQAVHALYKQFYPDLCLRSKPNESFGLCGEEAAWPHRAGWNNEIRRQYCTWWGHIHAAANGPESAFRGKWQTLTGYVVRPTTSTPLVYWVCRELGKGVRCRALVHKVAAIVRAFLHGVQQRKDFTVKPVDVEWLGPSAPGLGVLQSKRLHGRFVLQVGEVKVWDQTAIGASLEHDASFARNCPHVTGLYSFSCRYQNVEAACESWVGTLKYLWNPVQGSSTSTLTQRLRAHSAGVRGLGFNDAFVQTLAETLYPRDGKQRHTQAIQNFMERERLQVLQQARPLLQLSALQEYKPPGGTFNQHYDLCRRARASYEHAEMEEDDLKLADQVKARNERATGSIPFYAVNKKQWQEDLGRHCTAHDRAERVEKFTNAQNAKRIVPPRDPSASSSSSSSSSSTSSSESSAGSRSGGVPEAPAAPSAGGLSPSSTAGVEWVRVRRGKLHVRVDTRGGDCCKLCDAKKGKKPMKNVAFKGHALSATGAAAATGANWCKKCCRRMGWPASRCKNTHMVVTSIG